MMGERRITSRDAQWAALVTMPPLSDATGTDMGNVAVLRLPWVAGWRCCAAILFFPLRHVIRRPAHHQPLHRVSAA